MRFTQNIIRVSNTQKTVSDSAQENLMNKIKELVKTAPDWIIVLSTILSTGTIWVQNDQAVDRLSLIKFSIFFFAGLVGFLRIMARNQNINKINIIWISLFIFLFAVTILFSGAQTIPAILVYGQIIGFMIYATSFRTKLEAMSVLKKFVQSMTVIALISLFFYVFASVLDIIQPTERITLAEWQFLPYTNVYAWVYFEPQAISFLGYIGYRNCAIFCEAPMFAICLCFALSIEALFMEANKKTCIILLVAILTTFSTTAYFAIILIYIFYAFRKSGERGSLMKTIGIPLLLIGGVIAAVVLLEDKSGTDSYGVRFDHLMACFKVFESTFPFGSGFGNNAVIAAAQYEQGMSVGLPYFIAEGGMAALLCVLLPICFCIQSILKMRSTELLGFLLITLWLFSVTNVVSRAIAWMFICILIVVYPSLADDGLNHNMMESKVEND